MFHFNVVLKEPKLSWADVEIVDCCAGDVGCGEIFGLHKYVLSFSLS